MTVYGIQVTQLPRVPTSTPRRLYPTLRGMRIALSRLQGQDGVGKPYRVRMVDPEEAEVGMMLVDDEGAPVRRSGDHVTIYQDLHRARHAASRLGGSIRGIRRDPLTKAELEGCPGFGT